MSPPRSKPPADDRVVIIADAEAANAQHVKRQLARAGVKNPVTTFENGDDLHTFLVTAAQRDEPKPCLLFLDPHMPGANGYDPVRWVLREKSLKDMNVVIFVSEGDPPDPESAAELGVHLFIKKHPDLASLAKALGPLAAKPADDADSSPRPVAAG